MTQRMIGKAFTARMTRMVAGAIAASSLWFTGFDLCHVEAAAPSESLLGVEVIEDTLPILDGAGRMRDPRPGDEFEPMRVLLSRSRYWQQDGHMDVVIRLSAPEQVELDRSYLQVRIRNGDGERTGAGDRLEKG